MGSSLGTPCPEGETKGLSKTHVCGHRTAASTSAFQAVDRGSSPRARSNFLIRLGLRTTYSHSAPLEDGAVTPLVRGIP